MQLNTDCAQVTLEFSKIAEDRYRNGSGRSPSGPNNWSFKFDGYDRDGRHMVISPIKNSAVYGSPEQSAYLIHSATLLGYSGRVLVKVVYECSDGISLAQ